MTRRLTWWLAVLLLVPGCVFDPAGRGSSPVDGQADVAPTDAGGPDGEPDALVGEPAPPLGVSIPGVVGLSPPQTVNAASVTAAEVVVTLGPGSRLGQQVLLRVQGGGSHTTPTPQAATQGAGAVAFAVDLSAFADGPLLLAAAVSEAGAQSVEVTHTARKDTTVGLWVDPVVTPVDASAQWVSGLSEPAAEILVGNTTAGATAVVQADAEGYFEAVISLAAGANQLDVRAVDAAWNEAHQWADRFTGSLLVDVVSGVGDVVFTQEAATRLSVTVGSTPCADSAAASFALVRAPDLVNGDVAPDFFVGCANQLFLNDGQGHFTAQLGTGINGDRGGVWGDFDNDGDQDLAVTRYGTTDLYIYRNELIPGGAVDFTLTAGLFSYNPVNPEGLAWLDFDRDGWLDLFLNDGGRNELLQNDGAGQSFAAVADTVGANTLDDTLNNGSWLAVTDFDVDGEMDVALSDDVGQGFLLAAGSGFFSDVTQSTGASFSNPHKRGLSFGDVDNDGYFDLFVPQGVQAGVSNALLQYDGVSGGFTEVSAAAGVDVPLAHDGAAWGDVNLDGLLDLVYYRLPGGPVIELVVQYNRGDQDADGVPDFEARTQQHPTAAGFSPDSALLADVDNDGDLDLLVASRNGGHLLFINPLNRQTPGARAQNRRFLRVLLLGNGYQCNRTALGSVVLLRDCATQEILGAREVNGGRGNGGQQSPVLHFGGLLPSRCVQVEARFLGGPYVIRQVRPIELQNQTLLVFQP